MKLITENITILTIAYKSIWHISLSWVWFWSWTSDFTCAHSICSCFSLWICLIDNIIVHCARKIHAETHLNTRKTWLNVSLIQSINSAYNSFQVVKFNYVYILLISSQNFMLLLTIRWLVDMMLSMTFNGLNYGEIESQLSLVSRWLHDKLHFTYLIASILSLCFLWQILTIYNRKLN